MNYDLKKLQWLWAQGRINRRTFLQGVAALGLSATVPSLLTPGIATAATPKKGGRFRLGVSGASTTNTLDPAIQLAVMTETIVYGSLGNGLVEIDADGNTVPELAESWEASADAKKWMFKLRKGVEFHNGKTMTADDVIYSLNWHRKEGTKSAAKALVEAITDIKKDGDSIIFQLENGNADFPYTLSDYHLVIGPADTDLAKGVFTGGYVLQDYNPGVRAFATRNPNYFKSDRAWFDEIEIIGINDVNARTNALKTGEIDAMNRVELKTAHLFQRLPGVKLMRQDGFKHFTFPMLTDQKPFDNNDIRMALKYGIDREQLVKTILHGFGTVGNDHPIGQANRYHAAELEQRTYDPDKAKFYLKKSGLNKLQVTLHTAEAAFEGAVDAAVLYKEHAAKAGITIDVAREPDDGYWSNVWTKKPWCAAYWGGRPTEDMMFSTAYAKGAAWNDTHWDNSRFNELLIAARAELDEKKRRGMYVEMQQLVKDDGGAVVPMFSADLSAASDKIGHGKLAANWELDGLRATERWWFAS